MTRYPVVGAAAFAFAASVLIGCGGETSPEESGATETVVDTAYLLEAEPAGSQQVFSAIESAQDGEDLVVVGRIGGSANPWVNGMAAFQLVDTSLTPCNEMGDDDHCDIPWDYCCEPDLADSRTFVKFVDETGNVVATDAQKLLGVKELQTVVIQGKAKRDEDNNLTVLAKKIFVKN